MIPRLPFVLPFAALLVPQSVPSPAVAHCARSIGDMAQPGTCLQASSVPELGKLFPNSSQLYLDAGGNVGVGTLTPGTELQVRGTASTTSANGMLRAAMRPSTTQTFGLLETFGFLGSRTSLVSTVSFDPNAGAVATQNGGTFLTLLTTPANDSQSGYVSVLSGNVEVAGIDGGTGVVFGAAKTFVQPHPDDASKEIAYVSLEGPEHGVYFRGSARLTGGRASIEVPESFRLVARAEGLTVSLTPTGPSAGLYVARKGLDAIEVAENRGGTGDAAFDFLVMGVRSALPEHAAVRANAHFAPEPGSRVPAGALPAGYRELLVRNGTLNADGSVNEATATALGWRREGGRWTAGPAAAARPVDEP